ncbi:MAG: potassium-transporting ATPase subunit B, partial [Acidobacteriaceae bacterium]
MAKSKSTHQRSIWDAEIARRALIDSLPKLNPLNMMKNPVMFVVEVGSVITTALLLQHIGKHGTAIIFNLQITLWLW